MIRVSSLLLTIFLIISLTTAGQPTDSLTKPVTDSLSKPRTDSLSNPAIDTTQADKPDSIIKNPRLPKTWSWDKTMPMNAASFDRQILSHNPYFGFAAKPVEEHSDIKEFHGKELLFYLLLLMVITYAFLRLTFPKYFNDLFSLFFRTTIKQRQIREQLMQTPLPSFMLNGFFVVCGGMYCAFVLQHYQLNPLNNFWLLGLYAGLGLAAIYFIKFLGLKLTGWVFDMPETANAYIFIVFVINKMLGLFLLPFLILLAFAQGELYPISLTLSYCVLGGLLIYRFILSYAAIRNHVKVNPFHFFLYLLAFEIAPLLLIYKGLLLFFRITA